MSKPVGVPIAFEKLVQPFDYDTLRDIMTLLQRERDTNDAYGDDEPVTAQEVLEFANNDPEELQELLNKAKELSPDSRVGEDIGENFVAQLVDDWQLLPSDIKLQQMDWRKIRRYLEGRRTFSQLTPKQAKLVDSLRYEDTEFDLDAGMFVFEHEAVNTYNLREQLIGKLVHDGVLSRGTINNMKTIEGRMPEKFGPAAIQKAAAYNMPDSGIPDAVEMQNIKALNAIENEEGLRQLYLDNSKLNNQELLMIVQKSGTDYKTWKASRGYTEAYIKNKFVTRMISLDFPTISPI